MGNGSPVNELGNFVVKLPAGTYELRVFCNNPDFGNPEPIKITLANSPLVAVTIDAVIYAVSDTGAYQQAKVDSSNGNYALSVSAGTWHLGYYIDSEEYVNEPLANNNVTVNAGDVTVTKNIFIRSAGNTITGTVQAGGEPVPGILVFADSVIDVDGNPQAGTPFATHAVTDAEGSFTLRVPDGDYVVGTGITKDLTATYLPPVLQAVAVSGGEDVSDITLDFVESDAQINGEVTLAGSAPGGDVYITAWSDRGAGFAIDTEDGTFSLKAVAGEKWYVDAIYEDGNTIYTAHGELTAAGGAN